MFRILYPLVAIVLAACAVFPVHAEDWRPLKPGLELREFLIPDQVGDLDGNQGGIAVLRINPEKFDVVLATALETGEPRTMKEWARFGGFVAVINAGMFRSDDRLRSTGFMRNAEMVVNSFLHPSYGAFLVFHPRERGLPPLRWVDRKHDADWAQILDGYDGVIQNYRLIGKNRENLWTPSELRHSAAAIGMDQRGWLLFMHCRPRLSTYEFAQALLDLPLDLFGAMYVEGGADAAMFVEADTFVGRWVGEYRSDFFQGSNTNFWPAPNVLGIRPK